MSLARPRFDRPVFVLCAPRSGSTYLHEIIRRIGGVWSLPRENDPMWWRIFPPARDAECSDRVTADECDAARAAAARRYLAAALLRRGPRRAEYLLRHLVLGRPLRYAEKTVANCFHVGAILRMFPDARFVHLVRDARATVSSMIEGWENDRMFLRRRLPLPERSTVEWWRYPVPPGWRDVAGASLEEICAWSWVEHQRHALESLESLTDRWIRVRYEDLLDDPRRVIESVSEFAEWGQTRDALAYAVSGRPTRVTVSPPEPDKWKRINASRVQRILPAVAPTMRRLGYASPV